MDLDLDILSRFLSIKCLPTRPLTEAGDDLSAEVGGSRGQPRWVWWGLVLRPVLRQVRLSRMFLKRRKNLLSRNYRPHLKCLIKTSTKATQMRILRDFSVDHCEG